nr:hypothetical protein [Tanacetum cinerariifolium]
SDVKSASTPVDMEKTLVNDADGNDVDVHLYRSMIRSLMYRTTSRPNIMYAVCVCAIFQVTPKKVKVIRCDNGTEFKNSVMNDFYAMKDLPNGKETIGTKWVFMNKKDERGILIKNKASLVTQGHTQEEGFKDLDHLNKVYKVVKALYGLHQAPRACQDKYVVEVLRKFNFSDVKSASTPVDIEKTLVKDAYGDDVDVHLYRSMIGSLMYLTTSRPDIMYAMSSMGELTFFLGLQVKQKNDGIFVSQDKYVAEILKKFGFTEVKNASTPIKTQKPFLKDEDGKEVDVHIYRSMIGLLMYLTSSRLDIMFVVCACARYQVNPMVSHLFAMKRIFRYLKGQPKLGLWYLKDYPFDLVAYTDSDYARASLDRKSTTGGCQFLRCRLISWQCKKQTVVANSITKVEYVVASSCSR